MKKNLICVLISSLLSTTAVAHRFKHITVADGITTSEVHQIVELPNGQMLINCVGVFCLYDGLRFNALPLDKGMTMPLPHYLNSYGHFWQGDSLLWLRDLHRLYLFDTQKRAFINDIPQRLNDKKLKRFVEGATGNEIIDREVMAQIDSLDGKYRLTTTIIDRQGGIWAGTREGILYLPPQRSQAKILHNEALYHEITGIKDNKGRLWKSTKKGLYCWTVPFGTTLNDVSPRHFTKDNVQGLPDNHINFICELTDGRFLICSMLNRLGYFNPEQHLFISLNEKLPHINDYRHIVGACPLPQENQVAVYTQNGIFVLDTKNETMDSFSPATAIERYSDKYNCMIADSRKHLWVGTQNGLFKIAGNKVERIAGLANNCIRSLVEDADGHIWTGTSCGISRVTPIVCNYTEDDGVPQTSMEERAALVTDKNLLLFCFTDKILVFDPQKIDVSVPMPVVLTAVNASGTTIETARWQNLTLPYDQNYIEFEFSAMNHAHPAHTHYRYKLQGLDHQWIYSNNATGQGHANYNALPHGRYTFEVQAAIADGQWGPLLQQEITIQPPLWLTWWAKLLYAVLFLTTITFITSIVYKRNRKKLEQENEARINRLFELREKARHQFAKNVSIDPAKVAVNIEEEKLMKDLLNAVEAHIDDEGYNVDLLARDVAMSRTNLYNKLQIMLGITPADFIRNVRLKRAAQILASTPLSINEVATRVGFVTPRNFSSQFKKMFGVLPSEYKNGETRKEPGTTPNSFL